MANFDAIAGRGGVDVLRIERECVEGSEEFAGRKIGRGASDRPRKKEQQQRGGKESHKTSVVTFGMEEQG